MMSFPIGALLTAIVFISAMGTGSIPIYFNAHAALIVLGGTFSILLFSNPLTVLKHLSREIGGLFRVSPDFDRIRNDLIKLGANRSTVISSPEELVTYAQDLWSQGISQDLFVVLISQKRKEIEQRAVDATQCLKNLAKYPPSLGMAGTVMGIVSLFQNLDSAKDKVGLGLAMAMTATFFGLILSNGLIMPLSDRLQVRHLAYIRYLQNVYQIILLINQDESESLIADEVRLRAG
jgi:flagellar motor component MotA